MHQQDVQSFGVVHGQQLLQKPQSVSMCNTTLNYSWCHLYGKGGDIALMADAGATSVVLGNSRRQNCHHSGIGQRVVYLRIS